MERDNNFYQQYFNILSEIERIKIVKFLKPLHKDLGPKYPSLQTPADIHTYPELREFVNRIQNVFVEFSRTRGLTKQYNINKCWSVFKKGTYRTWHTHPTNFSMVYYLDNPDNLGTIFKKEDQIISTQAPQNSLIIFPSSISHSAPVSKKSRYSIAIDFVESDTKQKEFEFSFVFMGQAIMRYDTPPDILKEINQTYEKLISKKKIPSWESHLIGKVKKEHSLYWGSTNETKHKKHNFLSQKILDFFKSRVSHFVEWNKIKEYKCMINSVWVNEMKEGEYNPVHIHSGDIPSGLSSVLILKLPKSYGKEYARSDRPTNGQLQLLGNSSGQFCKTEYNPTVREGDFFLFPYDMRHGVYPFRGKGKRRTLGANFDVDYDPYEGGSGIK